MGPVYFVRNKYLRWYLAVCERARIRVVEGPTERHHVLPGALGGTDDCRVRLTFREHFLCHWLLTKFTVGEDRRKMLYALNMMSRAKRGRIIAAWQYAVGREAVRKARIGTHLSEETKAKLRVSSSISQKGKPRWSASQRLSIGLRQKGVPKPPRSQEHQTKLNKPKSEVCKARMRAAFKNRLKKVCHICGSKPMYVHHFYRYHGSCTQ